MKYLFEAIDKAIADYENDNNVTIGCYLTFDKYNNIKNYDPSLNRQSKYEYNGSTFVERPELVIKKRTI